LGSRGIRADFDVTNLIGRFEWLRILSTLIAFFVFLFSIVFSFYHITFGSLEYSDATYWSYKADHFLFVLKPVSSQSWFFHYWFGDNNPSYIIGSWVSWILLAMFAIQILTLAFGAASLVIDRRIILSVPLCLSLTVLAMMFYVGYRLSSFNYGGGYQLGYYLVFPSVAMFVSAFALNEVVKKKQRINVRKLKL
jgi:hypothetical protein